MVSLTLNSRPTIKMRSYGYLIILEALISDPSPMSWYIESLPSFTLRFPSCLSPVRWRSVVGKTWLNPISDWATVASWAANPARLDWTSELISSSRCAQNLVSHCRRNMANASWSLRHLLSRISGEWISCLNASVDSFWSLRLSWLTKFGRVTCSSVRQSMALLPPSHGHQWHHE